MTPSTTSGRKNIQPKHKPVPVKPEQTQPVFIPSPMQVLAKWEQNYNPNFKKSGVVKAKRYNTGKLFIPAGIFILCLLLYSNTLKNGYALDDEIVTFKNNFIIKGFSAVKDIFDKSSFYGYDTARNSGMYRPLVLLSFMTEAAIFGFNPLVSHFFNILFFAMTAVMLYFFLQKILKQIPGTYREAVIIASTLIFVFHPIHTEVVANIKSRDEILGLLFGLISFYFILQHQEQKKTKYLYYSLAGFFASILCKENCLTFIAVIPLLLWFFTNLKIKAIITKSLPFLGLIVIYMFIRSQALVNITFANKMLVINNTLISAHNFWEMTATSFVLLGKYIYMTIIPFPLSYDYSYNQIPIVSWSNIYAILSLLVCAGLIVYMFRGFKKKSIFSFLTAFFFITLFLSSNLVIKIASTFAERFLYIPSLSFCIALPLIGARALKMKGMKNEELRIKNFGFLKYVVLNSSFFIPLIWLLSIYTIIVIPRNAVWRNNYTLFSSGIITAPNSIRTQSNLAHQFADSAKASSNSAIKLQYYSRAIKHIKRALEIGQGADWLNDLGEYYEGEGKIDSATYSFNRALELEPNHSLAANNLGIIYTNATQYDTANFYFLKAINADSNSAAFLLNLGTMYYKEQKMVLARNYYMRAIAKDPNNKVFASYLQFLNK